MLPDSPFDLGELNVCVAWTGDAAAERPERPPKRCDGLTIGTATMDRPAPHAGELHRDGDELLYVVSGRARVVVERAGGDQHVELEAGRAFVVPRGTWHRVIPLGLVTLMFITPGPNTERRALTS